MPARIHDVHVYRPSIEFCHSDCQNAPQPGFPCFRIELCQIDSEKEIPRSLPRQDTVLLSIDLTIPFNTTLLIAPAELL
jgi:hypothetical protein